VEAPLVTQCRDTSLIRRVVRRHLNEVRFCYEKALLAAPALEGRVAMRFTVAGDGQVSSAEVHSSTLGAPEVERCIADAVERWQFPATPGGAPATATYPFVFKPSE
jgi:TonB family protein